MWHGKVSSPMSLSNFYVATGRQTGRTHTMIHALPENGMCVIICHNQYARKHIIQELQRMRPKVQHKNIHFVYSKDGKEIYPPLYIEQQKLPCYIDNAVIDLAVQNIFKFHNKGFNNG